MMKGTVRSFVVLSLCLAAACGYSLHGKANLPFQTVRIGTIVNKTFEPKLEDRMQTELVRELLMQGFLLDQSAPYRIEGSVTSFALRTLSAKEGTALEYEVTVRGDFRLVGPSDTTKPLKGSGVFIVSFLSAGELAEVLARKELATERAVRDLASELVSSIIYP